MVSRSQRRIAARKRTNVHRSLRSSKSVNQYMRKRCVTMDAFHQQVEKLASKVEKLNTTYNNLMKRFHVPTEVRVEMFGNGFLVRVSCEKGRDLLVAVLEAFEEVGLNVLQARVSCNHSFWMEAIGEADGGKLDLDVQAVKQAILKALEDKGMDIKIASREKYLCL